MKRISSYSAVLVLGVILLYSCSGYPVKQSKPGETIPPVTNLKYSVSGSNVTLTWGLPSSYPANVVQPVSVYITVRKNNKQIALETVPNAPTSYTYPKYDPTQSYGFTVRVEANIKTTDKFDPAIRYSPGKTVFIKAK